jgi:hypothetical protein
LLLTPIEITGGQLWVPALGHPRRDRRTGDRDADEEPFHAGEFTSPPRIPNVDDHGNFKARAAVI